MTVDPSTLDPQAIVALARAAGREIQSIRARGLGHSRKADGSVVTEADRAAEILILAGLERLYPGIPALAEEASADHGSHPQGEVFWCIDPLDGTRGFVDNTLGEYTVNIALVTAAGPAFGVIDVPAMGQTYWGGPQGAFRQWGDAPIEPIRCTAPTETAPLRFVASRSGGDKAQFEAFLGQFPDHQLNQPLASSLKFCRLAEGAADVYPRFGPVCLWDVAAGQAIVQAAGGILTDLTGHPLCYHRTVGDYTVRAFVAVGGGTAPARVMAALKR